MENRQLLFGGFERLQNFPLDSSSIFRNLEELDYYVKNNRIAYPGQLLVVFSKEEDRGVYYIIQENNTGKLDYLKVASIETDKKVEILEDKVTEIERDYVKSDDLKRLRDEILGADELDKTLDTVREIQDWIINHGQEFKDILDSLEREYVKKDELDKILADINGVERSLSANFGGEDNLKGEIIIPGSYTLTEIKIIIKTSGILQNSEFNGLKLSSNVAFGKDADTLVKAGQINFGEEVDKDDDGKYRTGTRPNIYIFTEFYPMNGEEHKLYFDVDDFGTVSGTITAKITKN